MFGFLCIYKNAKQILRAFIFLFCFLVFVFSYAGVFFVKVFLSVRVDALGNLFGFVGKQPTLFAVEGIVELVLRSAAFFKRVHTCPYAAAGSAYGVIGHTRGVDIAGRCEKR